MVSWRLSRHVPEIEGTVPSRASTCRERVAPKYLQFGRAAQNLRALHPTTGTEEEGAPGPGQKCWQMRIPGNLEGQKQHTRLCSTGTETARGGL